MDARHSFYLPYLLVLFLVPLLVRWRWGVVATLMVTVVEIALVAFVFYLMAVYHLLPDVYVGEAASEPEHLFAKFRRGQAAGYVRLFAFGVGPAIAALAGGCLALAWAIVLTDWRAIANRTRH